jgi:DNA-binding transcriptional regulator YiaG
MAKTYKSEALAALHESMSDLHQVSAIDSKIMREFDRACLTLVMELSPAAIRHVRAAMQLQNALGGDATSQRRDAVRSTGFNMLNCRL